MYSFLHKSILLVILAIGCLYLVIAENEKLTISRSSHWYVATGKLLSTSDQINEGTADKLLFGPTALLSFIASSQRVLYTYEINGHKYTKVRCSPVPTFTIVRMIRNADSFNLEKKFHAPQLTQQAKQDIERQMTLATHGHIGALFEMTEAQYECFCPNVTVRVNPKNLSESEPDSHVLESADTIRYSGISMLLVSFIGMLLSWLHTSVTSPVADPMLSLETALAYREQKRQAYLARQRCYY
jgi:hypothetical protein